tara:strand:+ start:3720 stop:4415 length:696 start_codon:yes stop_codon:yes gene_type:complete
MDIIEALKVYKSKAEDLGLKFYAIGLKGSQNYGLDDSDSDIDANLVFIPTLQQLRDNKVFKIETEFGECVCHNIYSFAEIVAKGNPQLIEVCHSQWQIGNFDIFKDYKVSPSAIMGMAESKAKDFCKATSKREHVVKFLGYEPKNLLHIIRLYDCLKSDLPFIVYVGTDQEFMINLKHGDKPVNEAKQMRDEYMYKLDMLCKQKKKDFVPQSVNYDLLDKLVLETYNGITK